MPEYLAPGVYIEETSFRAKTIEGVSTSTAGFVGPTRFGPIEGDPQLVTSFGEFERIYGGLEQLIFEQDDGSQEPPSHNYLAHGVRAFFGNGGRRLYISRVYQGDNKKGCASDTLGSPEQITIRARHPGVDGRMRVTFIVRFGQNALVVAAESPPDPQLKGIRHKDTVLISASTGPSADEQLYRAARSSQSGNVTWEFHPAGGSDKLTLADLGNDPEAWVSPVTVSVVVAHLDREGEPEREIFWEDLCFEPSLSRSLSQVFAEALQSPSRQASVPIVLTTEITDGPTIAQTLIYSASTPHASLRDLTIPVTAEIILTAGSDGKRPESGSYEGEDKLETVKGKFTRIRTGLRAFEATPDISIVAAPGHSSQDDSTAQAIANHLISHCADMRYRIAIIDSRPQQGITDVRAYRAKFDSTHASFYYPWVVIADPVTEHEIKLPPSGFIAGIYARNDVENGVHKAPANEIVRQALDFEFQINRRQQEVLNPEHINVLRFFEGRGYRVWGARTLTSDPEWKYVNLRRYIAYLERSIERGTQWAVFENNGPKLWANVRRTIETFLFSEFRSGHLFGLKQEDAYFVRCDLSTMTQNDIDNGRLVCLIGVALLRPAEFVIFRIGQFTADRRV